MPAKLVVKAGLTDEKEYSLDPEEVYAVGRARDSDIVVKDQRASRRHCIIQRSEDGRWTLADNQSSNGTYLNRQRIDAQTLHDGDTIQVGQATLEFQCPDEASAPSEPEPAAPQPQEPPEAPEPPAQQAPTQPEAEAPAQASDAAQAEESDEDLNEELKGLFDFLDRIDAGEEPAAPRPKPTAQQPGKKDQEKQDKGEEQDEEGLMDFLRKKKQDE